MIQPQAWDDTLGDDAAWLSRLKPWAALGVLIATALLLLIGLLGGVNAAPGRGHGQDSDAALYGRIVDDLRHGERYYPAVARELRQGGYPLRPFVAFRPPLQPLAMAALPDTAACVLALRALALATLAAWLWRLRRLTAQPARLALAVIAAFSGIAPALAAAAWPFHEVWAGLLIALSLALYRPGAWRGALVLGLLAACMRELAGAYLLAMAALAWRDGRRGEAAAWLAAIAVFAVQFAWCAHLAMLQVRPGDPASNGWLAFGGWPFVLRAAQWNGVLSGRPGVLAAILVPLALLGLLSWRGPLGERMALTTAGYMAAFTLVGRPDNNYWGLIIAPLWPLGLVMAWPALTRLWSAVRSA